MKRIEVDQRNKNVKKFSVIFLFHLLIRIKIYRIADLLEWLVYIV